MRVLTTELKKLFSNGIFLLIISAVFVLNAYLMFRTSNSGDAVASDYRAVYSELEGLNDSEKLQWLNERLSKFEGQHSYNWTVLEELRDEAVNIAGYSEYLDSIDSQAKSMTSVSIFAKPDTFNYRSIVKTPPAYDNVRNVVPIFDISKGIKLATDNSFTDILCGFIVLFAVLSLMISDREQGMSGLLFALKHGRGYLLSLKLIALAVTIFSAVLLIYTENFIVAGNIYGLGDLSRPIQSLNGFIGCNLKISVFEYLILYVLFKFIAMFAIGAVLSLIAVNTKNIVSFYGISAVILIAEGLTYAKIHPLSIYSIFRYINLISLTKVNEIFCNYKNINFWEYPVPLIPTSIGAVLIISVICVTLSAYLYAKKRNLEFRKIAFRFRLDSGNKVHSPLYYTFYKSLFMQKGFMIIIIFIAIAGFMNQSFIKKYDPVDVYYQYYTTETEGEITQDTINFYDSEAVRFEELNARLNDSNISAEEEREIIKQLAPSMGFYPAYERLDQIKSIKNSHMFYDTGYKRAFGVNGYDDDMKYALMAILLCLFLVSPLISNDNKYRMSSIVNSTKSGRKSYIVRNIFTTSLYGVISALLWIIPYSLTISEYYGHDGLFGSVQSITDFASFPINMKLWQYIVMISLLRILALIFISMTMLYISSKCRNITSTVLINFAVFALPIIIYLLGADFMINIGFNPLLSVNIIINEFSILHIVIPMFGVILILIRKKTKLTVGM